MLKKIILFGLIFLMVITQTSCGSIPQKELEEIPNSEYNNSANRKKDKEFTQRLEDRESLNIIYEDAVESDVIYYMSFDGTQEEKIAEI